LCLGFFPYDFPLALHPRAIHSVFSLLSLLCGFFPRDPAVPPSCVSCRVTPSRQSFGFSHSQTFFLQGGEPDIFPSFANSSFLTPFQFLIKVFVFIYFGVVFNSLVLWCFCYRRPFFPQSTGVPLLYLLTPYFTYPQRRCPFSFLLFINFFPSTTSSFFFFTLPHEFHTPRLRFSPSYRHPPSSFTVNFLGPGFHLLFRAREECLVRFCFFSFFSSGSPYPPKSPSFWFGHFLPRFSLLVFPKSK